MNLNSTQQYYLQTMGLDIYCIRTNDVETVDENHSSDTQQDKQVATEMPVHWQELRSEVAACTRCELHKNRTQTVFGVGDPNADWLIIGEAPGAEEDRQGEPFVGRAGKLLNSMLMAIGLERKQVFIANILKCRPPSNRDPKPEEVISCESYLKQQIEWIKPKLILALGRVAAQNLLKVETPIGKMRGQRYEYPDPKVPVVVTYHPAYLLRSPKEKRKSWQDLQLAMQIYKESL
jgi:DNA polymerase